MNRKDVVISVEGMACEGCEKRIQNALLKIDGVYDVNASHAYKVVRVICNENIDVKILEEKICDLGFEIK